MSMTPTHSVYRMTPDDLSACTDPKVARQQAVNVLWYFAQSPHRFFGEHSYKLLSYYFMAAALDGADLQTVRDWAAHPDDRRPVELLRSGPVPQWADDCERILSLHEETLANVLVPLDPALISAMTPDPRRTKATS